MRVGFFGGGNQALAALEAINGDTYFSIAFIHTRDEDDKNIATFSERTGTPIMPIREINSESGIKYVRDQRPDLILSINCKQIFKPDLLAVPPRGAINMHNGLLPRQRGRRRGFCWNTIFLSRAKYLRQAAKPVN